MRILVTGAGGFVAQGLVAGLAGHELVLTDLQAGEGGGHWLPGDLTDPAHLAALTAEPLDVVYHLASIPGSLAEARPELGWAVNLLAPQALFARLAATGNRPRVVFASSIAVFGPLGPGPVREDAPPAPTLSYGAHKWMIEILLADLTRRGELDGVSLRLPGIVARPPAESGHGSGFMSQIFHKAAARTAYDLPVSAEATCWWMSRETVVANLLHAANMDSAALPASRVVQLPVLVASVGAVLNALETLHGPGATAGFTHTPDPRIETLFGCLPPLTTPKAEAAGFRADP
ncbi:MAG: NAD-dependent epimerase/dehydratase family protein, partial [Pararhodobacter sp.]